LKILAKSDIIEKNEAEKRKKRATETQQPEFSGILQDVSNRRIMPRQSVSNEMAGRVRVPEMRFKRIWISTR
jgi:hypothetical protein